MRIAFDDHDENIRLRGGQLYWADACYVKTDMLAPGESGGGLTRLERDARLARMIQAEDLHLAIRDAIGSRNAP